MLIVRPVRYTDQDAFATSHYHISNAVVERASVEEVVCCFKASFLSAVLPYDKVYVVYIVQYKCTAQLWLSMCNGTTYVHLSSSFSATVNLVVLLEIV